MRVKSDKKDQILAAAEKHFALRGYDATSVRDICQEADVNVAMVNYYFGSKEGLFREMVDAKATYMRGKLKALLTNKALSSIDKMDIAIEHQVNRMFSHKPFTMCVIREMSKDKGDSLKKIMSDIFLPNMKLLRSIIQQGIRSSEFRKVDIELTIATIIGSIWNIISSGDLMLKGMSKHSAAITNQDTLKKRLIKHLHQLIRNHLLIGSYGADR
jgi:TetR/AcrR family transcriptional regulator, fatty acid metabolism regulator protein